MTRVDIPKLVELLNTHPNKGFVFDFSVNPATFTLDREELEQLIWKAEVKE